MISTFLPRTVPPTSSAAMRAASAEPGPALSLPQLDISVSTPMRTTSSETCAEAIDATAENKIAASIWCFMSAPPGAQNDLALVSSQLYRARWVLMGCNAAGWADRLFWYTSCRPKAQADHHQAGDQGRNRGRHEQPAVGPLKTDQRTANHRPKD